MLTSDLYWTDWRATNNAWESVLLTLRRIERNTNGSEVMAHVVRVGDPLPIEGLFTAEFVAEPCFADVHPPVFYTIEDAKAYAHMTCLLILKEN